MTEFGDRVKTRPQIMEGLDDFGFTTTFNLVPNEWVVPVYCMRSPSLTAQMMDEWDIIESVPHRRQADYFIAWSAMLAHSEEQAIEHCIRFNTWWFIRPDGTKHIMQPIDYEALGK